MKNRHLVIAEHPEISGIVVTAFASASYTAQSADFVHLTLTTRGDIIRRTIGVRLADGRVQAATPRPFNAGKIHPTVEAFESWMIAHRWDLGVPVHFLHLLDLPKQTPARSAA